MTLLSNEDRALLTKVSNLLEEIIETLEIIEDKKTMKSLKEAELDVKTGQIREYNDFIAELKKSGNL